MGMGVDSGTSRKCAAGLERRCFGMDDMDLSVFSLDLGDKHTDNAPVSAPDDAPKPTPTLSLIHI